MTSEQLDEFIGKKVRVVFTSKVYLEGFLGYGDINLGVEWIGTGYHLTFLKNRHSHFCGFKNSHVKTIEEIP